MRERDLRPPSSGRGTIEHQRRTADVSYATQVRCKVAAPGSSVKRQAKLYLDINFWLMLRNAGWVVHPFANLPETEIAVCAPQAAARARELDGLAINDGAENGLGGRCALCGEATADFDFVKQYSWRFHNVSPSWVLWNKAC